MSEADSSAPRTVPLDGPAVQVELARAPTLPEQLTRALWRARGRQQGVIPAGDRPGPIEIVQRQLGLDAVRIARFRTVCADAGPRDAVPAVFLETLFIGPMAAIALHPRFPFSPLGLVHLRQQIHQRRWVRPDEQLDLRCGTAALRETARGYEVDCSMELRSSGEEVWTGLATLLSRNRATRGRSGVRRPPSLASPADDENRRVIDALADVGRRYAAASGDYNPHHLYPLTARLVGFKRPIAHGMWTLARALAELGATTAEAEQLVVEAAFKRPVFLPGRVAVRPGDGEPRREPGLSFEVFHPERGEPHVVGTVRW